MRPNRFKPKGRAVARYDYTDEGGRILYTVFRHDPKGFTVRTAAGGRLRQGGRYPRVPYRLLDLMASDSAAIVFVVEGEKDVERLRREGLIATCNAFGGGKRKWTRGHSRYLRGRRVVIIPDNDGTGDEHARCIAQSLCRLAASVRLLRLPGLPPKGDVSDYLDQGHTATVLQRLAEAAPEWKPQNQSKPAPDWTDHYYLHRDEVDGYKRQQRARREIYGLPIKPTEKLLLLMVDEFSAPPQTELAMYLGVTTRRVRQMIQSMVARGYLKVAGDGKKNRYHVLPT
jgi:hypothetical protein